jgi:hypothetical protein
MGRQQRKGPLLGKIAADYYWLQDDNEIVSVTVTDVSRKVINI